VVNTFTGRGSFGEAFDNATRLLSKVGFSPKKLASDVQKSNYAFDSALGLLRVPSYMGLPDALRREVLKMAIAGTAARVTLLHLMGYAGFQVWHHPASADFGKFVKDKLHGDIWGGALAPARLLTQIALGKLVSTTTGREFDLNDPRSRINKATVLARFIKNREHPTMGLGYWALTGLRCSC
jgi:hypothetical protein